MTGEEMPGSPDSISHVLGRVSYLYTSISHTEIPQALYLVNLYNDIRLTRPPHRGFGIRSALTASNRKSDIVSVYYTAMLIVNGDICTLRMCKENKAGLVDHPSYPGSWRMLHRAWSSQAQLGAKHMDTEGNRGLQTVMERSVVEAAMSE